MKKIMAVLLAFFMLAGTVGCRKNAEVPVKEEGTAKEEVVAKEKAPATRTFTDSVGRTVEIPYNITKVAVSGPLAQIMFYGFAPELLAGWCSDWSGEAAKYIPDEYLKLPTLGQLYGSKGELNLEELLAVGPDVVVDIGEPKGSVKEDLDALSSQTGIPFVHITATTDTMGDAIRMLGELTGLADRAEEYASYCENVYNRTQNIMSRVGGNKARALYCLGDAGCNVIAMNAYQSEIIDLMTDNQAAVENPTSKGTGNEVDLEQILIWNPDFIVFAPDSIYGTVADDPAWQEVNAIRNGNYVEVPAAPYNWLGYPPSVQRYLGMMWLASVLYPEQCDYDLKAEVKEYYRMFYHVELSDAQYDELTVNSFVK